TFSRKNDHSRAGGGAGLVSVDHVARSRAARAGSSSAFAGRMSTKREVRLEAVQAALAAEARLLVAPEGARGIEAVVRVRPHDAGAQPVGHPEDARALLGPDAGGEPVRGVVRLLDGLLRGAERQHAE